MTDREEGWRPCRDLDAEWMKQDWLNGNVSCWACRHIRIAEQFSRWCAVYPKTFVWSAGYNEKKELELDGRKPYCIAEECPSYELDLTAGPITDEDRAAIEKARSSQEDWATIDRAEKAFDDPPGDVK